MIPAEVPNLVAGQDRRAADGRWLEKTRPADGAQLCRVSRSDAVDAAATVAAAADAQPDWGSRTHVERGDVVRAIAELLRERRDEASEIVAAETGKPLALARGETWAAIEMGFFVAGEGRRSYGRTTTASMPHRTVMTLRRPVGVAALLISFNTPLPNVAWKAFPSILCGNAAVLKPSEHAPLSAWWMGRLCLEAGLPPGVLNVVHGLGPEAGLPLVEDPRVDLVSFTGSAGTGRVVAEAAGRRLAYAVFTERSNVWSLPVPPRPPAGLAQAAQVTSGNQIVESFDFSPDRHWLAYDSDRSGVAQLYRVPLAGGEPEQLTTDSSAHFWPRWSPDGREIAYHAFQAGGRRLFIMNADGSNVRPLPFGEGDDRGAEWRRDGGGLYYLHNFDAPDAELRFIGRDASGRWGSPETLLRIDPLPVALSPDGRRMAIPSDKGLLVTGLRADSARNLFAVGYRARAVRPTYVGWSTDSRTIYCLVLDSVDRASVVGIDATSGERKLLVRLDDPAREWHRYGFGAFDGRLYFTLGDRQSDLWTAAVNAGR